MTSNNPIHKVFTSVTPKLESDNALDFVLEAKDIVRLAAEHAQVCSSFRKSLEDNGIGPTKANPQQKATQHTPNQQEVSITK